MAKQRPKPSQNSREEAGEPQPRRKHKPKQGRHEFDIVDEAGKESFPASDAPCWTP